jgi:hypothetical protein
MTSRWLSRRTSQAALLTAAAVLAVLASGCVVFGTDRKEAQAVSRSELTQLLDTTRLPDLDGAVKPLRDRMGPAGLLVVFVDTTCPSAAVAAGNMPSIAPVLARQKIPSVLVNLGDAKWVVERVYAARKVGVPVLYDTGKATQATWRITSVPTVVLLDSDGAVCYRGRAVWADVAAAAEKSLKLAAGSVKFAAEGTEFG